MTIIMVNPFEIQTQRFGPELYDRTFLHYLVDTFGRDLKNYCFLCPPVVIKEDENYVLIGRPWSYDVLLYHAGEYMDFEIPAILAEDEKEAHELASAMETELNMLEVGTRVIEEEINSREQTQTAGT